MKKLSMTLLSNLVSDKRQQKNMTQQDLSLATGNQPRINLPP